MNNEDERMRKAFAGRWPADAALLEHPASVDGIAARHRFAAFCAGWQANPDAQTIIQAITDPENQPSQFGTVTIEFHQAALAASNKIG